MTIDFTDEEERSSLWIELIGNYLPSIICCGYTIEKQLKTYVYLSAYWALRSSDFLAEAASCLNHFSFCLAESLQQQQQHMQAQTEIISTPPTTPMPIISAIIFTAIKL